MQISEEWSKGAFVIQPGDEDIHTANERRLKVRQGSISQGILKNKRGWGGRNDFVPDIERIISFLPELKLKSLTGGKYASNHCAKSIKVTPLSCTW